MSLPECKSKSCILLSCTHRAPPDMHNRESVNNVSTVSVREPDRTHLGRYELDCSQVVDRMCGDNGVSMRHGDGWKLQRTCRVTVTAGLDSTLHPIPGALEVLIEGIIQDMSCDLQ